jgi:hypothetical protein
VSRVEARAATPADIIRTVPWEDDDDWTGEPPEGHHTRDRAKPEFWRTQRPPEVIAAAFVLALIVLVLVIVLR